MHQAVKDKSSNMASNTLEGGLHNVRTQAFGSRCTTFTSGLSLSPSSEAALCCFPVRLHIRTVAFRTFRNRAVALIGLVQVFLGVVTAV